MSYLGEEIRKLGFGLMRLPMIGSDVDIEQTKKMVDLFMDKGFSYFDTSFNYIDGASERVAKVALVDRHPRDSFQFATKLPAWYGTKTADDAKNMFWSSLKKTGLEYFDFYLLHNLGGARTEVFDKFGIWDFLAEQKAAGRIKHLGFSMHATADFLDAVLSEHLEMEFVQLQINYSDWENTIIQSRRCYEVARKHGKPVVVMEPVKGGALANLPEQAAAILKQANPAASQASWALRFAASLEGVITVLSGMSTLEQMQDNVSVMEDFKPLTQEEMAAMEKVQAVLAAIPQIPCTDCKYCVKGCPENISIPGIFSLMNDYLLYHDLDRAKNTYVWETMNGNKASACVACGQCETACPQSIQIVEQLGKVAELVES
ncbi:MAG: aldo/keto reductase [Planctomycetes bacterium]|nr:aldo/keto reductase [Planctomycetota bacterium]